jgi:hypothetical protein
MYSCQAAQLENLGGAACSGLMVEGEERIGGITFRGIAKPRSNIRRRIERDKTKSQPEERYMLSALYI